MKHIHVQKDLNLKQQMSRLVGKPTMWFPNRSDTNLRVQSQKRARSLKFWSEVEKELYYPSSENKGADQLCGYRADLRLCFRLCRLLVFPRGISNMHPVFSCLKTVYPTHGQAFFFTGIRIKETIQPLYNFCIL